MRKIRIGVLGCAAIADRSVIPAILSLPEHFALVAVASRSSEKAQLFSTRNGCEAETGYESMLNRQDLDALYIPLPTGLHAEWVNRALEAGLHVYAEKSIAMNLPGASEMVATAVTRDRALMEGYMFQYHAQHQLVRQILGDGTIGELRHFYASFGFPPLPDGNFRYDPNLGGGVLMDAAGYPLRAAFQYLGDALEVTGATLHINANGTPMWGSAYMSGKAGGVGASLAFGFDNFYQCHIEFWGSKGKLIMHKAFTPRSDETPQITIMFQGNSEHIKGPADNHFVNAMKEFHTIITNPDLRSRHREQILQQSAALDAIRRLS
jgi:dTDP-3,4-didehydro-2,6-dideoxy-alpha-D-glucose 3-reductase